MATRTPLVVIAGQVQELPAADLINAAKITVMVGDTGAGGVQGAVPAPAAGDAANEKFLKANGLWETPTGTGGVTSDIYAFAAAHG